MGNFDGFWFVNKPHSFKHSFNPVALVYACLFTVAQYNAMLWNRIDYIRGSEKGQPKPM